VLKWIIIIVLLVAACVALAGWKLAGTKMSFRAKPAGWKTEKVGHGEILVTVTATGTVGPLQTVMVGAQISGKVNQVPKVANDVVKKGDVLALLDTELYQQDKRTAEVRLSQSRAALALLKVERDNVKLRQDRLKSQNERKRISIDRARGSLELAAKNRKRSQDLIAVDATTQSDLDVRLLEEENAKRDLRLMEIDLDQAEFDERELVNAIKQLDARELQANADVEQAEAALARAVTNLGYATILAPIDGVVLQQLVEPGQTVAASFQTPNMFKVVSPLNQVRIDAQLDEADIGKIRVGQEVTFDVDAYRGETFNGTVKLVKLQCENKGNLVTYPVAVEAANPPDKDRPHGKLLPGMTAGLKFVVEKRKELVLLPAAALRFIPPPGMAPPKGSDNKDNKDAKKPGTRGTVFVASPEGALESRTVRVGETDGDNYELLEGDVKDGDEVVVGTK